MHVRGNSAVCVCVRTIQLKRLKIQLGYPILATVVLAAHLILGQKVKVTRSQSAKHISVEGNRVAGTGVSLHSIEWSASSNNIYLNTQHGEGSNVRLFHRLSSSSLLHSRTVSVKSLISFLGV